MVPHLAPLVHVARVTGAETGVAALAGPRVTRQALRAVAVGGAADARRGSGIQRVAFRIWMTGGEGHADVALGTGATGLVQNHTAQRVDAAGATETARVHALQVYARLFARALWVAGAFAL